MAGTFQLTCTHIIWGLRDSIHGTLKVYKMDAQATDFSPSKTKSERTVLAQRRAERFRNQKEPSKTSEPKVMHRIFLCCAWNGGVFLLSIFLFNGLFLPFLQWLTEVMFGRDGQHGTVWSRVSPFLSWTFNTLWILPLFVLSKVVNCLWFQDIADAAYKKSCGRPQLLSLSKLIADVLFSLLLQGLFLTQGMLANFLPIKGVGFIISILHMCLLYSLYAFEYKWYNMGWEVHKRLSCIENYWPYYCGFGLPLAILTSLPTSNIISGCIFSILFPLFIISANEADVTGQEVFEFPLKLFSPVVLLTNAIFRHSVAKRCAAPSSGRSTPTSRTPVRHVRMQEEQMLKR